MEKFELYEDGKLVNTIVGTETGVRSLCSNLGYTYKVIKEEPEKEVSVEEVNSANIDYLSLMTGIDLPSFSTTWSRDEKSPRFEKVKLYYHSGLWTAEMVKNAEGKWITPEEYNIIMRG